MKFVIAGVALLGVWMIVAFGLAVPALAQADLEETTAIVATNSILIKANAVVGGDVVVNEVGDGTFIGSGVADLTLERKVTVNGDLHADDIVLKKDCSVSGTVFVTTGNYDNDCNSPAPTLAYGPTPVFALPLFSEGSPGGDDVIVQGGQTVTLTQNESQGGIIDVKKNEVFIRMGGGCQGCGMADVTLKQGVEKSIRQAVPQIGAIMDTTDHATGRNPYYAPSK